VYRARYRLHQRKGDQQLKRTFKAFTLAAALSAILTAASPEQKHQAFVINDAKFAAKQQAKLRANQRWLAEHPAEAAKQKAKRQQKAERDQARQAAWLAQQQWRAEHPAEAAYQDALAQQQAANLIYGLFDLFLPQPRVVCTTRWIGYAVRTVCY